MALERADDLALLSAAAEAAGVIALGYFRGDFETWDKPGEGPVTEADLAIDAMLRAELGAARPDYGWLSEESEGEPDRAGRERVFIVDPIDGTRAFIAGQEGWGVALAVAERGRVVAGAMHLPARGESFAAALGQGATLNGAPIRASGRALLEGAAALVTASQLEDALWPGGAPPVKRHFRPSLAWRLCLVGQGRFDMMVTLRPAYEWDIAAGSLIAAEAGAVVTDGEGGVLEFNRHPARAPGVIAAPEALHRALMARRGPLSPRGGG
ncbi:MAG: 3'(2'),5'-bisphosphate nucleotidase CysQ [Proteobacteria bacterium]|nr:3'(2'),5'-bisphosphate nucleotidase CysQ [Pseudomonadota bacterium]